MYTSVKFRSFRPCTVPPSLSNLPHPTSAECDELHAVCLADMTPRISITPDGLQDKNLKILNNFHGLLRLESGVTIYRYAPTADGIEEVNVGNDWIAEVEFKYF